MEPDRIEEVLYNLYGGCHTDQERKDRKTLALAIKSEVVRMAIEEVDHCRVRTFGDMELIAKDEVRKKLKEVFE